MTCFTLDCLERIAADVEPDTLGDQTVDSLPISVVCPQQINSGPERDNFDGDLVGTVNLEKIVSYADDDSFFLRVVVGQLQCEMVISKRLVG